MSYYMHVAGFRCHGDLCTRSFVHPRALLAIPDRRLDAPDLMSGTHITGHDVKLLVILDPGDLCTLLLSSPSQTAFKLQDSRS